MSIRDNNNMAWRLGFTLIELLVVIAILGVLVSIAIPQVNKARVKAKETEVAANLREVHTGLEKFGTDNNTSYPFRMRWFDDQTYNAAGFDPYTATDTGTGMTSDGSNWFSLGLFGGVRVVNNDFTVNINDNTPVGGGRTYSMLEHKVVQPYGWDEDFYEVFNQFSDPLKALGYIGEYPNNPFFRRPMGNMMWTYGENSAGNLDKLIPGENVFATPGDFCYSFFYSTDGSSITDPEGIVEAAVSYQAESMSETFEGMFYLDVVDSYQLWAYGNLPTNGGVYVNYPNNALGFSNYNRNASKDWNNSGTRDMFETGLIGYFKKTGGGGDQAVDSGGNRVEY